MVFYFYNQDDSSTNADYLKHTENGSTLSDIMSFTPHGTRFKEHLLVVFPLKAPVSAANNNTSNVHGVELMYSCLGM